METRRPTALVIGIVLLVLLSLSNIATIAAPAGEDGIPLVVIWGSVVLGIAGLVAAVGLWQRRRWGMPAALVVLVLGLLSSLPGLIDAPSAGLWVAAAVTFVGSAVNIVLLLLPPARRQFA